ncbi:MAG: QueT transporter family protein [Nitrospinae bacterium]|nr:QueT transporter family protein [Nitrospinota bacterium]
MRDLFTMWGNTRMVVLTAICASLYAAILIPFKVIPLIPGVTEFRPANAVPIVCSLMFGPAAAWGSGFGNFIGDFFGGMGPGSLFGFLGNFFYGLIPYKLWGALSSREPVPRGPLSWLLLAYVILLSSTVCGVTIGWGLNLLGFLPFSVLASIIVTNNSVVALVLSPLLLRALYPRVKGSGLHYTDLLEGRALSAGRARLWGVLLLSLGAFGGLAWGELISLGTVKLRLIQELGMTTATGAFDVGLGMLPAIALIVLGLALL